MAQIFILYDNISVKFKFDTFFAIIFNSTILTLHHNFPEYIIKNASNHEISYHIHVT